MVALEIFSLGIILILGLLGGKLVNRWKLPAVTGYILVGLLIGPAIFGFLSTEAIEELKPLSHIALGIIALVIGGELELKFLKRLGKSLLLITVFEAVGAFILVTIIFKLCGVETYLALVFGALATATAPAGTVAVIREFKSKGPLTESLLAVVALDDAVGVVLFGIVIAFSKILNGGSTILSSGWVMLFPFWEILASVALGFSSGYLVTYLYSRYKQDSSFLALTLGAVFFIYGLSSQLHLSPLLSNMALGFYIVNVCKVSKKVFSLIEGIEVPIFIAFFTLAGAELDISKLAQVGAFGVVYFLIRAFGKYLGTFFGGKLVRVEEVVQKYLGWGLVPQAGVVIGLMVVASQHYPEQAHFFANVILAAVVLGEVLGPICTRFALVKAGEAQIEEKHQKDFLSG